MKLWLAACSVPFLTLVESASAELAVNAGVDHVSWGENSSSLPESDGGNMIGAGLSYTEDGATGTLLAYRGRFIIGESDYSGANAVTGESIGGTAKTFILGNELQLRRRGPFEKEHVMDIVMGAGWEHWNRKIPVTQEKRAYDTVYFRLGVEFDTESRKEGWIGGVGMKYPLVSRIKRDFSSQGLDISPTLRPGRDFSAYVQLGYRFDPVWSLFWYYEGFRYRAANAVDAPGTLTGTLTEEKFNVNFTGIRVQRSF